MSVEILPPFVMMVMTIMSNGDEFRSYGPSFDTDRECHVFANNMRHAVSASYVELPFREMSWFCGGVYSEANKWFDKGERVYVVHMNLTQSNR